MVPWRKGTFTKFFLASSMPLAIASCTSFDFPRPWPTTPLPSPTTTMAAKVNVRPPLVTLVTRLRCTTVSFSSRSLLLTVLVLLSDMLRVMGSEIEAGFAGGVGQCLHPSMIEVAIPVEDHLLDAGSLGLLGDGFANDLGLLGARRGVRALVLEAPGAGQGKPLLVVDHLCVDLRVAAEHGEPWTGGCAPDPVPDAGLDACAARDLVECHGRCYLPAALPALRRTFSPTKRIPLPL